MTEATLNSAFVLCLDYTMDLLHFNVIKIVAGNVFFFFNGTCAEWKLDCDFSANCVFVFPQVPLSI